MSRSTRSVPVYVGGRRRTRNCSLWVTLTLSLLTIAACGETTPTQVDTVSDRALETSSLALASNSWTPRAAIPGERRSDMNAGVAENAAGESIVYVLGGRLYQGGSSAPATSIVAYNATTNMWTTKAATFIGATTNGSGKIGSMLYISGGSDFTGSPDDFQGQSKRLVAYDLVRDRIVVKADMPLATGMGNTGVINGKLYVLAGKCLNTVCKNFYRYDPATNVWTTLPAAPNFHVRAASAVVGGKFYVVGGGVAPNRAVDVYDPVTNAWRTLEPTRRRKGPVGETVNGKLYVIGAWFDDRTTLSYNPVTDAWRARAPFPDGLGLPTTAIRIKVAGVFRILTLGSGVLANGEAAPSQMYTP